MNWIWVLTCCLLHGPAGQVALYFKRLQSFISCFNLELELGPDSVLYVAKSPIYMKGWQLFSLVLMT